MERRAEYDFFMGAVGSAYVKLYTPLIPFKDELQALGFSPRELHANAVKKAKRVDAELVENAGCDEGASASCDGAPNVDAGRERSAGLCAEQFR